MPVNVGPMELIIVLVIALIVLGPKRLPEAGKAVGKGRVEQTIPMGYSADEACDVGSDTGSPASPDYGPTGNRFTGEIEWVQLDIGEDGHDHLITPEERFNLAMARQ